MRSTAAVLAALAMASTASAGTVIHVFAPDRALLRVAAASETTPPAEGEMWIAQDERGLAAPFDQRASTRVVTRQHMTLSVFSATTGQPIRGAAVWQCSAGCRMPILTQSTLRTNDSGSVDIDVAAEELRIWAPGYEWTAVGAPAEPRATVALWPGKSGVVHLTAGGKAAPDALVEYTVPSIRGATSWLEAQSNSAGEVRLEGIGGEKVRLEVVDPRYAFSSTLVGGGKVALALTPAMTLRGVVANEASKPLAGSTVEVLLDRGDQLPPRVLRAEAGSDGTFAIYGLPASTVLLRIGKSGFMTEERWIEAKNDNTRITLRRGRDVRVVVTAIGSPVAGATIRSMHSGRSWKTNDRGVADLNGLDPRQPEPIRIETTAYNTKEVTVEPGAKPPLVIALDAGTGVRFRVLSAADGRPITKLAVEAHQSGGTAVTDLGSDSGDYVFAANGRAHARVRLHADGYMPGEFEADPNDPPIDAGVIFLSRGASLRGRLIRAGNGKPLAGARLTLMDDMGLGMFAVREMGRTSTVTTDPDGGFEISGLAPGIPCIVVDHPLVGHSALAVDRLDADAVRDLGAVGRGARAVVRGRVEQSDGTAMSGIAVELRSGAMRNPCTREQSQSGADGGFTFRAEPGEYHVVALRDRAIVGHCATRAAAEGPAPDCVIRLRVQHVAGTVTIGDARVPGGTLQVRRADADEISPRAVSMVRRGIDGSTHQELISDAPNNPVFFVGDDGSFAGDASLDDGAYRLTYRTADTRASFVTEQTLSSIGRELRLDLRFSGKALSGRVADRDRAPAGGAIVTLWRGTLPLRTAMAAPDGSFRIDGVPPGSYLLQAARGPARARREVVIEDKDLDGLDLALATLPSASLTVRIAPPSDGTWTVYATDGAFVRCATNTGADDAAEFDGLPPGTYRLLLASPGGAIYDGGSAVTTGTAPVTIPFSKTACSALAVQMPERLAGKTAMLLTGDSISAGPLLSAYGRVLTVGDAGVLRLPPLSVGSWSLRVDGDPVVHPIAVGRTSSTIDLR